MNAWTSVLVVFMTANGLLVSAGVADCTRSDRLPWRGLPATAHGRWRHRDRERCPRWRRECRASGRHGSRPCPTGDSSHGHARAEPTTTTTTVAHRQWRITSHGRIWHDLPPTKMQLYRLVTNSDVASIYHGMHIPYNDMCAKITVTWSNLILLPYKYS